MERRTVGNVEVVALVDNVQVYPATAVYPDAGDALRAYARYMDADGGLALNFGCFAVFDGDTRLLVDTGWGPEFQGKLPEELQRAGIDPASITHVLFTHLHGDHTGWNLDRASGQPLFPRARYLVPKGDWDYYGGQERPPDSFTRDVVPLQAAGQMELIDGEHRISSALTAMPTPGHTPGHTSVAITGGSERGFILGDVVISPIDAEAPQFESSFDWDKELAVRTRRATIAQLIEQRALVGASHLPVPGLGRFVASGEGSAWQPV